MMTPAAPRRARRWYRHPRQAAAEKPPVEFPDVMFYGPYADRHDTWTGVYWEHNVQGWDGGWWEGWRFYLVLVPTLVLRLDVDRSCRSTRAYRRWVATSQRGLDPRPGYRRWRA